MSYIIEKKRKLEKQLNSLSNSGKKEFIKNDLKQRIIYSEEWKRSIDDVESVLDDVYPELWDYQFKVKYNDDNRKYLIRVYILLHFPLINITNGKIKHIIYDIFIGLEPRSDDNGHIVFPNFEGGFRMTHSPSELASGYSFSHMSGDISGNYIYYRTLCTGSGEINQTLSMNSTWSPNIFKLLLMQTKSYLEWESLSGVPYNHLRNVIPRNTLEKPHIGYMERHYKSMEDYYASHPIPDINFKFHNGYVKIVEDSKFENFIKIYGDNESEYYMSNLLAYKDVQGNYYNRSSHVVFEPNDSMLKRFERILYFRGKEIPYKIHENISEQEKIDKNQPVYIKPQLIDYVRTKIEYKINKGKIRDHIIGKLNTP